MDWRWNRYVVSLGSSVKDAQRLSGNRSDGCIGYQDRRTLLSCGKQQVLPPQVTVGMAALMYDSGNGHASVTSQHIALLLDGGQCLRCLI